MLWSSDLLVGHKDYVAGWLDSSVHDFLGTLPRTIPSMEYAWITCLDSNPGLDSLFQESTEFQALMREARPVGHGLLLPARRLLELESREQVFFGFDEVWFFPDEKIDPKPDGVSLVGPSRVDQQTLNRLGPWMDGHACALALGDGEGLNFIVKAKGLVRSLLGHSSYQPAPARLGDFAFEEEHAGVSPSASFADTRSPRLQGNPPK